MTPEQFWSVYADLSKHLSIQKSDRHSYGREVALTEVLDHAEENMLLAPDELIALYWQRVNTISCREGRHAGILLRENYGADSLTTDTIAFSCVLLEQVIGELSEEDRAILIKLAEGFTYREICTSRSVGAMRVHVARLRQDLKTAA